MKKIISCFLALCASVAFGATTVPVQLLNPTGSTAGQAIVSTGSSSAPSWGGVGVNGIAAIASNSVIGNATGSTASPTAITVTGCNGAAQALQWTNGTGFGCNSSIATAGANSNITSLTGLVSLTASGTITPSQTAGIVGTTAGNNAQAGSIGEYATASTTGTSATSGTPTNCASETLTAGDWDVTGIAQTNPAATTTTSAFLVGISPVSATFGTVATGVNNYVDISGVSTSANSAINMAPMTTRMNLVSNTAVYLVCEVVFATSTMTVSGFIRARRVR